jgi:hypothetical protein
MQAMDCNNGVLLGEAGRNHTSPRPREHEYQNQFVASAEGNSRAGAWYALKAELYGVLATFADRYPHQFGNEL